MTHSFFPRRIVPGLVLAAALAPAPARAVPPGRAAEWRADLAVVRERLPETHANLFHALPRAAFEARLDSLDRALPELDDAEITVALAGIVAAVGDGHTRLTLPVDPAAGFFTGHSKTPAPKFAGLVFRQLPIRLFLFDDGLFITRIDRAHADAAGARVLRIGDLPAAEAVAAVEPVVQRDNAMQLAHLLPDDLVIPEILAARGVCGSADRVTFRVAGTDGVERDLVLDAVPVGESVDWVDLRPASVPPPLSEREAGRNYRLEWLPDERVVYVPYNEVYDMEDEDLDAFADRLFRFIDDHPVEALVLDVRRNPGGDNARNAPLLKGLIRCRLFDEPGRLFVLAGRGTFSAALMFCVDLEKNLDPVFVGEGTGGRPNGYGDSRKVTLPNSGLTIRVSTLYWQYSDPRDERPSIEPEIAVPLRSSDARAGRDAGLEVILDLFRGGSGAPDAGSLAGPLCWRYERYPVTVDLSGSPELRSEALGVPRAAITDVRRDGAQLAFAIPDIEAEVTGSWRGGRFFGWMRVARNGTHLVMLEPEP